METGQSIATRRDFLKTSTGLAVGATLASTLAVPRAVHAGASETLRVGLVGCGGRGTGAGAKRARCQSGQRAGGHRRCVCRQAQASLDELRRNENIKDRVQVADDHIFTGFDAYKQVIDSGVDVVILATPPHFRPQHLAYAVEKGKHAFVEKPVAVDAPGVRSVIETCEKAKQKDLAIVSGLCWRYHPDVRRRCGAIVEDKAIGDIVAIQSSYNAAHVWHRGDKPEWSRMEYQIRNWLYFDWLSGDHICEQAVHSLDKTAWLQGDIHPVQAFGMGGRQQRTGAEYGNIYDHHTVFYEYPNGVRVFFTCRQQKRLHALRRRDRARHEGAGASARSAASRARIRGRPRTRTEDPDMFTLEHVAAVQEHSRRQADQQRPLHGQQHDAGHHGPDVHVHRARRSRGTSASTARSAWDRKTYALERQRAADAKWRFRARTKLVVKDASIGRDDLDRF